MKALSVGANIKTIAGHDSYNDFATQIFSTANCNTHLHSPPVTEKLKALPDQYTSGLAHEIRNPLTNINLSVGMLQSLLTNDDLKVYLDIIMRSSTRINDLITQLLKHQLADEVVEERYAVHQLLDEVLESARDRIALKNISVVKDYTVHGWTIGVNRLKMKIALTNIIINAIEAMTSDEGRLKLVTKSTYHKNIILIEDNGCGIRKENMENIFSPYFTDKSGGLGIGLSTTYEILQSNHIGINVKSLESQGTRFKLLFSKPYRSTTSA